jgi:hypothetical protein
VSTLEDRVAALETELAKLRGDKAQQASNRGIHHDPMHEPCDGCETYGKYRCYDGPLECPKFYRWAMRGATSAERKGARG